MCQPSSRAAVLVALTCVHVASQRGAEAEPRSPREDAYTREVAQSRIGPLRTLPTPASADSAPS